MKTVVITASYNGAPWIRETLTAVAQQTCPAAAHWVVDDGSTDDTVKIATDFPGVTVSRNPGKGPNAARAFCVTQTTSKYVAILDQDDLWHPSHLALLEAALETNPNAPAAFSGVYRFHTGQDISYSLSTISPKTVDLWDKFPRNLIWTPAQVLIRRDALMDIGGWPANIVGVADFYTWLCLSAREPLVSLFDCTVGYRQHAESYSSVLRKDRNGRFLEHYLQAAAETINVRKACRPEDVERHEAKLKLFSLMTEWLDPSHPKSKEKYARLMNELDDEIGRYGAGASYDLWLQALYFTAPSGKIRRPLWLITHYICTPWKLGHLRQSLRPFFRQELRFFTSRFTGAGAWG